MNAITLRDYQWRAVEAVENSWRSGRRAPLLCAPTGSGKTIIAAALADRAVARGQRVLVLIPRREIVNQMADTFDATGNRFGIVMAGDDRRDDLAPVFIASVDTVISRTRGDYSPVLRPDVVLVDESHLFCTAARAALLQSWPSARLCGMTATPCRSDGRGLRLVFDDLIEAATVADLTAVGYLVPARYYSIAEPDLAKVRVTAGDYNLKDLNVAMDRPALIADITSTWLRLAGGRKTIVFGCSIGHAMHLAEQFRARGVAAAAVSAETPHAERAAIFEAFRQGRIQVMTNAVLASIGVDIPTCDAVVLARPTRSLSLFLQCCGRGLRPAPGKSDCMIIDHSGAVHAHGFVHDDRGWSLDGRVMNFAGDPKRKNEGRIEPAKYRDCPSCFAVFKGQVCPSCGWHHVPRGIRVETIDGELVEVGAHVPEGDHARLRFFLGLRGHAEDRGFKAGWAAHSFYEKFNEWPPREWSRLPAATPDDEVRRWLQYQRIRWMKGREAARRRAHAGP